MMFAILKEMAENRSKYMEMSLEVVQDGFGFLRSTDANYLPGPDDICKSFSN